MKTKKQFCIDSEPFPNGEAAAHVTHLTSTGWSPTNRPVKWGTNLLHGGSAFDAINSSIKKQTTKLVYPISDILLDDKLSASDMSIFDHVVYPKIIQRPFCLPPFASN